LANKILGAVSLAGFGVFGNKICQTVGDEIFFPPHIILGVGKQRNLGNKICQTVGDALIGSPRQYEPSSSISSKAIRPPSEQVYMKPSANMLLPFSKPTAYCQM
jgi:hypothetical protein